MLLALLSKLKLQHFLVLAVLGLVGFSVWALGEIKYQKLEKQRQEDNYENLRDFDSLKVANLTFRTAKEMEDYIDTNKDLSDLLKQQDIKLRKTNNIIYQKQQYIDNINNRLDVTGLVEKVRKDIPAKMNWTDSTACLIVKGNVTYSNDSLAVNITKREFDNKIAIVGGWQRDQRNFFTRIFGRKKATVKASSKCGTTETLILEKQTK